MKTRLKRVLGQETEELTRELECQAGIPEAVAPRFMQVASEELVASYEWQKEDLSHLELADPRSVRAILSAVCAGRIARDLGLSMAQVWLGLRALAPRVLALAASLSPVESPTWPWKPEGVTWPPRRTLARAGFLHPIE